MARKKILAIVVAALTCLMTFASDVRADGAAENLILVVNQNSPESLAIANLYIDLRKIPRSNVVYLNFDLQKEATSVNQVKKLILEPVFLAIEERNLTDQIDYIAYSSGFPTRVGIQTHLKILLANTGEKYQIQKHAPWGSLSSITYNYASVMKNDPSYMSLDSNRYFRGSTRDFMTVPFTGDSQREFQTALQNFDARKMTEAVSQLATLAETHPEQVAVQYHLARALAQDGKFDESIEQLGRAVSAGWCYKKLTGEDSAFAIVRRQPEFKEILDRMADERPEILPTRGFQNRFAWGPNGWPNHTSDGKRFMISTVLAVSPKIGGTATLQESLAQIKRTAMADGTRPEGKFYFAKHKNVRSRVRSAQFQMAVDTLLQLGFEAEIISDTVPQNSQVIGATLGSAKIAWASSGSQFQPGAICDNFTSYGGWMEKKSSQTPITDFLKYGAAGASGAVYEPYAIPPKFPHAMIQAHYAKGCTLGEAFYQSIQGPFQMLIVGDPLCRPFAKLPEFEITGISDGQAVQETLGLQLDKKAGGPEISHFELFVDGRKVMVASEGLEFQFPVESLSPGYHEMRFVAIDDTLIRTRKSKRIEFVVERDNKNVSLDLVGGRSVRLSGTIVAQASSTAGNQIRILQNSRELGLVDASGQLRIAASKLGLGKTILIAVVGVGDQTISSMPLEIEITK